MSSVQLKVQVKGVKEALRQINKVDPKLRRQFTKRYKDIVKPVIQDAKARFPNEPPLSGMGKPYKKLGGWDGGLVAKGVVAKINTRKARNRNVAKGAVYETVGAFIVQQKTGWGSLYDMAGKKRPGSKMNQALVQEGFGSASRAMWPAYEKNQTKIDAAVKDLVNDVMKDFWR